MQMRLLEIFILALCTPTYSIVISPRIAIIGGGIGGTSCAYFLRSLFGENALLDLYEAEKVGGRLSIVPFGGKYYEVGGSIIHPRNRYMSGFLDLFNLMKREQNSDSYLGLYNGKNFVFEESTWQIVTLFKLLKRYHFGFWKLRNHINNMLDNFDKIYKYQDSGVSFNNVTSLLEAMDPRFVEYLHINARRGFEEEGFSETVIDELVMATLRTNYGQDLNVHKFVGSVSVAGASGGLWAFNGGNAPVAEKLLELSGASLIHSPVTAIRRLNYNEMEVLITPEFNSTDSPGQKYDIIVIASPQTADMKHTIQFKNFKREIKFSGRYHRTVCTLIKGKLRDSYFHNKEKCIDAVLSIDNSTLFNSIGRINPVDYNKEFSGPSDVWKIFSQNLLTEGELKSLFTDIREKYVKVWLAYPEYDTSERSDSFILDNNLYHANAIEWAASSMEMSVIGAKNVALLALQAWQGKDADENNFDDDSNMNERNEL